MAYAGLGLTPTPWLELALAFNYEGAAVEGIGLLILLS